MYTIESQAASQFTFGKKARRLSSYEESTRKRPRVPLDVEIALSLPLYSSVPIDKWKSLPRYITSKITTLKDLLNAAWNSTNPQLRTLVPVLSEINGLVGLGPIKEWVVNIVLYVITYEHTDDDEMFTVRLTGIESKSYIVSLIKRLYGKLGVCDKGIKINDNDEQWSKEQVLWCFEIPRYTNKQLCEIFGKMVQRDGWSMEQTSIEMDIGSVKGASHLLRLCKICRAKRMILGCREVSDSKVISKDDLLNAIEMYRKRRPSNIFTY